EQRPQRNAAVDEIFPLVASVIPAAGHLQRIRATGPDVSVRISARDTGCAFGRMARRPRPLIADEPSLDRNAGTAVIEILERVVRQPRIDIRCNRERVAALSTDDEAVSLADPMKAREVDAVDVIARFRVAAE